MDEITLDATPKIDVHDITENPVIDDIPSEIKRTSSREEDISAQNQEPFIIETISSAAYGGLTKILSLLTLDKGKMDIFSINQGKLNSISGGGHLYCDLSELFKGDFGIIDPQYNIKLMRLISGGDEVTFTDHPQEDKYYISNIVDGQAQVNIKLAKPDHNTSPKISAPELGEKQEELSGVDPELVATITTSEKTLDSQFFILEIFKDDSESNFKIASISTDYGVFKYSFKEVPAGIEPIKYKVFNPFPIPKPDEIKMELYDTPNEDLWIKTTSEVGMASVEYTEKLVPVGTFDTFTFN